MKWTEEKILMILQQVLVDIMNNTKDECLKAYSNRREYRIKKGSMYDIQLDFERINQQFEIGGLNGQFELSILPWKQRKIKKTIKKIRYLIDNAAAIEQDRKQSEAIMKAFPSIVNDAFEKTVLK